MIMRNICALSGMWAGPRTLSVTDGPESLLKKIIEEIFKTSTDIHLNDPKTAAHIVWSSACFDNS